MTHVRTPREYASSREWLLSCGTLSALSIFFDISMHVCSDILLGGEEILQSEILCMDNVGACFYCGLEMSDGFGQSGTSYIVIIHNS